MTYSTVSSVTLKTKYKCIDIVQWIFRAKSDIVLLRSVWIRVATEPGRHGKDAKFTEHKGHQSSACIVD